MTSALNRLSEDFHDFAWKTNILASTAGFSIGIATKEMIEKVLARFGYPDALWAWLKTVAPSIFAGPPTKSVFLGVLGDVLVWLAVLFMTFVVSYYLLKRFIGVSNAVTEKVASALPTKGAGDKTVVETEKPGFEKPYYDVKDAATA